MKSNKSYAEEQLHFLIPAHELFSETVFRPLVINNSPGVYVAQLTDDSNAYKLGLRSGDRLLSVQGKPVQSRPHLDTILTESRLFGNTLVRIAVSRTKQRLSNGINKECPSEGSKKSSNQTESSSNSSVHSISHQTVSNMSRCHLYPYSNATGPSPSRSQPTLSTLTTDSIVSSPIGIDCDHNDNMGESATGPDVSPTSIGGYDISNENFKRYVTPYPTNNPNPHPPPPMERVQSHDSTNSTSPVRPFQGAAQTSQPRLVMKPHYGRPSPNYVPIYDTPSSMGLKLSRSSNKTPSQSMNELRLNDSPVEYPRKPSAIPNPRLSHMPSHRFTVQSTPKINLLQRKPTNLGASSGGNSKTPTTTATVLSAPTLTPGVISLQRRATHMPMSCADGHELFPLSPYSSVDESMISTNNNSLVGDVRVINTPTKDVTVYRRPALPSAYSQNRSKPTDYGDSTNLTRIPSNLSKSIDSSQTLCLNLSVESSVDKSGSETQTPSNVSGNERGSSRRSSDDLLGNTIRCCEEPQLGKMTKFQNECCVRSTLFKTSEYERSHTIGFNKERTALSLDRRYFAPYMADGLPHVDFPLMNAQMKIITTRRTLRLRHSSFQSPFFVMFEDDCFMRSWAAVITSYIASLTPSPVSCSTEQDSETKPSKTKSSSEGFGKNRKIFKIRVPNRKVATNVLNPLSSVTVSTSQLITFSDTDMRVINACLAKCVPSPQNPDIPLFLEVALEIVERHYCTTPGLYRLSANRQVVDAAIQGLSKSPSQVKLEECEEVFTHPKDLTSLIKTFTRSLIPRFFQETTMNSFLKYVSHPNLPLDVPLSSSETSRPVDINAEGVKKCLLKLWRGQLEQDSGLGNDEKDSSIDSDKDVALIRQRLTYLCLKRLCLHISLMGNHACDKSHRLNVHGLASMFACNWHDSTDPLIITFMNKLIAVLSEQYEWFFDECISPLSKEDCSNQHVSLSSSNPRLEESTEDCRKEEGDTEATRSPGVPDTSEDVVINSPVEVVRHPQHHIAETIEASESVRNVVLDVMKQRLQAASESCNSYDHLLTYSDDYIPKWSSVPSTKDTNSTKFHQEIDIDAAVCRQLAKNKDFLSLDASTMSEKNILVSESDEEAMKSERETDLPQLETIPLKASALRNRRVVGVGGLGRDPMNAAFYKPVQNDSLDTVETETSNILNKSFTHSASLLSP